MILNESMNIFFPQAYIKCMEKGGELERSFGGSWSETS